MPKIISSTQKQRESHRQEWLNATKGFAMTENGKPTMAYFRHIESLAVGLLIEKEKRKELIEKWKKECMEELNG